MGFFTWTFANRKIEKTRWGDFRARCKLPYYGYGCVMCPDGSVIEEHHYKGYGIFDGKDIFELLVDWNRLYLVEVMNHKGINKGYWFDIAKAYQNGTEDDVKTVVEKHIADGVLNEDMRTEWKRELGIEIAYKGPRYDKYLPYPIKITDKPHPRLPYDKLPISISCQ